MYSPPEKCQISAGKLKSETPNQGKNELHLGKNPSVARSLIKILKLGGMFTFFIWAYICREVRRKGNYLNKSDQMKCILPHEVNKLFHHFPQLDEILGEKSRIVWSQGTSEILCPSFSEVRKTDT